MERLAVFNYVLCSLYAYMTYTCKTLHTTQSGWSVICIRYHTHVVDHKGWLAFLLVFPCRPEWDVCVEQLTTEETDWAVIQSERSSDQMMLALLAMVKGEPLPEATDGKYGPEMLECLVSRLGTHLDLEAGCYRKMMRNFHSWNGVFTSRFPWEHATNFTRIWRGEQRAKNV